jgi:hypothetical protein
VLGKWTAKYLPTDGTYVLIHGDGDSSKARTAGSLAAIYRPRIVCGECNSTWMSQIEQRAEDAGLGIMIRPQRGETTLNLDLRQQRAIATWAGKVALLTPYLYMRSDWVLGEHLAAFHRTDRPPSTFAVWLGAYAGTGPYCSIQPSRIAGVPIPGRMVTFYVGHAFFQVFLGEGGSPYSARSPDITSGGFPVVLRLWPPRDASITWPTLAMDRALVNRLGGFAPAAVPR